MAALEMSPFIQNIKDAFLLIAPSFECIYSCSFYERKYLYKSLMYVSISYAMFGLFVRTSFTVPPETICLQYRSHLVQTCCLNTENWLRVWKKAENSPPVFIFTLYPTNYYLPAVVVRTARSCRATASAAPVTPARSRRRPPAPTPGTSPATTSGAFRW